MRVRGPQERRRARALEVLDQLQVTAVADRAAEIRRERQVRAESPLFSTWSSGGVLTPVWAEWSWISERARSRCGLLAGLMRP